MKRSFSRLLVFLLWAGLPALATAKDLPTSGAEFLQNLVSLTGREMTVTVEDAKTPVPAGSRKAVFQAIAATHFKIVTQSLKEDGTWTAGEFEEFEIQPDKPDPSSPGHCLAKLTRGRVGSDRTASLLGSCAFKPAKPPLQATEFGMVFYKPEEFYPDSTHRQGTPVVLIIWENNPAQFNSYTEPTKNPARTYRSIKH